MGIFSEEFIHDLPDDPKIAGYKICSHFLDMHEHAQGTLVFKLYIETYAILDEISNDNNLEWFFAAPIGDNRDEIQDELLRTFTELYENLKRYYEQNEQARLIEEYSNKYRSFKKGAFVYEFSDGDLNKIQTLINNLREKISISALFEESHRRRLMNRLEKLQQEIHKKQSDLDHYWGLVGDAGVAIGKFGKDAKPFVELIKEITNIVWRTQAKAEELPSDTPPPLLSNDEKQI